MNDYPNAPVCPRCHYRPNVGAWKGWYDLAMHFFDAHDGRCLCGYLPPDSCVDQNRKYKDFAVHLRDHPDGVGHLNIYHTLDVMAKIGDL